MPARCQRGGGGGVNFACGHGACRERCADCSCQDWFDQWLVLGLCDPAADRAGLYYVRLQGLALKTATAVDHLLGHGTYKNNNTDYSAFFSFLFFLSAEETFNVGS